jgi:putative hydrolase of the HAD superfamily
MPLPQTILERVRAVSFDAGGTLLYPYPSVGVIYDEVMCRHGVRLGAAALEQAFQRTLQVALQRPRGTAPGIASDRAWWHDVVAETLLPLATPDDFEALFAELWEEFAHPDRWRLFPGTAETLTTLRQRGYRLALLSNWDERLRQLVEGLALSPLFDAMIISCEVGAEKPDRAIFAAAEAALQLPPAAILHIGDSPHHDLGGATGAGWPCLLVDHYRQLDAAHPRVSHLAELLALLP